MSKYAKIVMVVVCIFLLNGLARAQVDGDNTVFDMSMGGGDWLSIRGIYAGSDLDQDGKYEVLATEYAGGGRVHVFEAVGNDALEEVWVSPYLASNYGSPVRHVAVGDLDGDGNDEIIVPLGDTDLKNGGAAGIVVFEWDGTTDNGYDSVAAWLADTAGADSVLGFYAEGIAVYDIDGDDHEEVILPMNGSTVNSLGVPDDRFIIFSVTGSFPGFYTFNKEYELRRASGSYPQGDFGGSPYGAPTVGDLDGDDHMEFICQTWNNLTLFVIEATGPDTYIMSGTFAISTKDEIGIKGGAAGDIDNDGKDEFFIGGYVTANLWIIDGVTESQNFDTTNVYYIMNTIFEVVDTIIGTDTIHAAAVGGYGYAFGDQDHGPGSDQPDIYITAYAGGLYDLEYTGTDPTDSASYTIYNIYRDTVNAWLADKGVCGALQVVVPPVDLDKDGNKEAVISLMDTPDSTLPAVRVIEWAKGYVGVEEWEIITKADYILYQNRPNPFSNNTEIRFSLPRTQHVTLKIYNSSGRLVRTLACGKFDTGIHAIKWDGRNSNGSIVAAGVYFYQLKTEDQLLTKKMLHLR